MNPERMERSVYKMFAFLIVLVIAVICGLNPFSDVTLFWVGVLSVWCLRP